MQQLQFETSWDKALAGKDRAAIEKAFEETKHLNHSEILCIPLKEAINHKEELLVTVLVHNFTNLSHNFHNTRMRYSIHGEAVADNRFTLPALEIPPHASMPWTFIFPKGSYSQRSSLQNGQLEIL